MKTTSDATSFGSPARPSGVLPKNSSLKLTSSRYFKKQNMRGVRGNEVGNYKKKKCKSCLVDLLVETEKS